MDIDTLRSFVAIIDTGSFSRAAEQVFRTQSAVSLQIKKLEQELEQKLFDKQGRSMELTDAGKLLAKHARLLIHQHDQVTELLKPSSVSELFIGCPDDYAHSSLPLMVQLLQHEFPNLSLKITVKDSIQVRKLLDAGELDCAIVSRNHGSHEGYFLRHDQGVWLCNNPDLLNEEVLPLALYEPECGLHVAAVDVLGKANRSYKFVAQSSSGTALNSLVREGLAVSAMLLSSKHADTVAVSGLPELPHFDIALITSANGPISANLAERLATRFRQLDQSSFKVK